MTSGVPATLWALVGCAPPQRAQSAEAILEAFRDPVRIFPIDITSANAIWPLIKPLTWYFTLGSTHYKSCVEIDLGWLKPHVLMAKLDNTELYVLEVQG